MNELQELYREVILDHNRQPRNFGELEHADRVIEGVNPLCGDRMTLYVNLDGERVSDIRFKGTGCAISVASSSLMTEKAKGTSVVELRELFERVHAMLTGDGEDPDLDLERMEKLAALSGVRAYPTRVKCATLAWHALIGALSDAQDRISTE